MACVALRVTTEGGLYRYEGHLRTFAVSPLAKHLLFMRVRVKISRPNTEAS